MNCTVVQKHLLKIQKHLFGTGGYYCDTDEGVWYELYFNDEQKKYYPKELDLQQTLDENFKYGKNTEGFKGLLLFHFEDENQITFFVSHSEEEWTFDKMTDIFYQKI